MNQYHFTTNYSTRMVQPMMVNSFLGAMYRSVSTETSGAYCYVLFSFLFSNLTVFTLLARDYRESRDDYPKL